MKEFSDLMIDVFWHILPFLPVRDIFLNVSLTEKRFYEFTKKDQFMKKIMLFYFSLPEFKRIKTSLTQAFDGKETEIFKCIIRCGLYPKIETRFNFGAHKGLKSFAEQLNRIFEKKFNLPYPLQELKDEENKIIFTMESKKNSQSKGYTLRMFYNNKKKIEPSITYSRYVNNWRRGDTRYETDLRAKYSFEQTINRPWYIPSRSCLETFSKKGSRACNANYYSGLLDGKFTDTTNHSSLSAQFEQGVIEGEVVIVSTTTKMTCNYRNGVKNGPMKYFEGQNEDLDLLISFFFKNGDLFRMVRYSKDWCERERSNEDNSEKKVQMLEKPRIVDFSDDEKMEENEKETFQEMNNFFSEFEEVVKIKKDSRE